MRPSLVPPPLWLVIFGALMWALDRYVPVMTVIPAAWNGLGCVLMTIAPAVPLVAFVQFWFARTTVNPHKPEKARTLVTSGIYAWTRNPMYLGLTLLLLGWAIQLGTLTPLLGPLLFVPLIERVQIRPEEQALRQHFAEAYEAYCRQVKRWVGRSRYPT